MNNIGVIGLGLIGGTLVRRLIDSGATPMVFDLNADAINTAVAAGAIAAQSSCKLAEQCDTLLVCVQTDEQCVLAISGKDGALEGARPNTCIAVMSTVLPSTIRSLAALAARRDVFLVDTPVAGRGMFSVEEGTMSVMVGDDGALVARLEPILQRFCSKIIPAGPLGSGAALKLAHNIVVYAGFAAMIEAVELAGELGVALPVARLLSHSGEKIFAVAT